MSQTLETSVLNGFRIPALNSLPVGSSTVGELVYDITTGTVYVWTGFSTGWVSLIQGNGSYTLSNLTPSTPPNAGTLVPSPPQIGPVFTTRSIVGTGSVVATSTPTTVELFSNSLGPVITVADVGAGNSLLQTSPDNTNPISLKNLVGSASMTVNTLNSNTVRIGATQNGRQGYAVGRLLASPINIPNTPSEDPTTLQIPMTFIVFNTAPSIYGTPVFPPATKILAGNAGVYLICASIQVNYAIDYSHFGIGLYFEGGLIAKRNMNGALYDSNGTMNLTLSATILAPASEQDIVLTVEYANTDPPDTKQNAGVLQAASIQVVKL